MEMEYKPPFRKFVKKQFRPFQLAIEDEVDRIRKNPTIGEMKKGDLAGMRVHNFSFHNQSYLIAYRYHPTEGVVYLMGSHENFYRDLKRYLREVNEHDYRREGL